MQYKHLFSLRSIVYLISITFRLKYTSFSRLIVITALRTVYP